MNLNLLSRRAMLATIGSGVVAAGYVPLALGAPQDPLPAGAKVLQQGTAMVTANGQASNIFVPRNAILTVDFSVEPGKELKMIIITDAQFKQVSAGRKITGDPVHTALISGVSAQAVQLGRGNYVLFFGIYQSGNAQLTYRAHFRYV